MNILKFIGEVLDIYFQSKDMTDIHNLQDKLENVALAKMN